MKIINKLTLFAAIANAIIIVPIGHEASIMLLLYFAAPIELINYIIHPPEFINDYYKTDLLAGVIGLIGMSCYLLSAIINAQKKRITFIFFGSIILLISYVVLVFNPFTDYYSEIPFFCGIPFGILTTCLIVYTVKYRKTLVQK